LEQIKCKNQKKKILLFPLANVLGHISRTFALAEQLCKEELDVYVSVSNYYESLFDLVDSRIKIIPSIEMYADATKNFGQISYTDDCNVNELELLETSTHLETKEVKRRGKLLKKIVDRDTKIINQICPDAIVIDYHYAPLLIPKVKEIPLFLISHKIGYPSLCRRVHGEYPYPLNENTILVPGIRSFENLDIESDSNTIKNNWLMCGMFSWQGWKKIKKVPEKNDVFLFFGSTGCAEKLTPWFIDKLSSNYRISYLNQQKEGQFLSLETSLKQTSLIICHGGHETVMECIKQKKPMIIIPNNLEQLEIGRTIEKLKLGILIAQPYDTIDPKVLTETIEALRGNQEIKDNLEQFSNELTQSDGAKVAADIIINQLYNNAAEKLTGEICEK
jgi:hypothetical protein